MTVSYARRVGLFSATMMVVGGIIGSGIFLNPAIVAQRAGSAELTLGVWVMGGVVALLGALVFAELGARRPRAGGGYVYLRDGLGPLPAFLYAWALLLIIATGAIAAVAVTFANYFLALTGLGGSLQLPVAIGAIVLLTAINYVGVRPGAVTQNVFTVLKLVPLAMLAAGGVAAAAPETASAPAPAGGLAVAAAIGTALVPVLFSYGGWQQTNFVAEELIDAERNLPRALLLGVAGVVLAYLLANYAYLRALGPAGLAASSAPAADAMQVLVGPAAERIVTAGIAVSTFGFLNLVILVSPRVYQAMAADGLFFPSLARLHRRFRTPAAALLVQGAWAVVLALSGTYGELLDYVVFGDWIFFVLTAATLFVFRRRDGAPPPGTFGAPLYPLTPALFIAAAVYVLIGSVVSNPGNAARGLLLLAAGVPVFWFWRRRAGATP